MVGKLLVSSQINLVFSKKKKSQTIPDLNLVSSRFVPYGLKPILRVKNSKMGIMRVDFEKASRNIRLLFPAFRLVASRKKPYRAQYKHYTKN